MLIWNRLAHFANALQSTVNSFKSRDFSTFGSLQFFNLMFSLWSVRPSSEHTPLTMEFVRFVSLSVHSWMLVLWWRSATLHESVKPHRNKYVFSQWGYHWKTSPVGRILIWPYFCFRLVVFFALNSQTYFQLFHMKVWLFQSSELTNSPAVIFIWCNSSVNMYMQGPHLTTNYSIIYNQIFSLLWPFQVLCALQFSSDTNWTVSTSALEIVPVSVNQ